MITTFKQIYHYRALVWALVARHLAVRYRGSALGFLWSLLNPLCLMAVYMLVFHYYIRFSGEGNYTIFLLCGLLPWVWFTSALSEGTNSIVASGHLITKSMFPAQILPIVAVITSMIHYLLSLPVLFLFMLISGVPFHLTLIGLPVVIVLQFGLLFGLVLMLGSINVMFRDVQHIVTNVLTFLFFLCPVVYPVSTVPERFRFTMELNPVALLTTFYHTLVIDGALPGWRPVTYVVACTVVMLVLGNFVFDRYRERFAEML